MRFRHSLSVVTACTAFVGFVAVGTAASAQQGTMAAPAASIDSGMTKAQVLERFGKPAGERSRGTYTYLFYVNNREKQVGMSDVVLLMNDHVVDAVLRAPARTYTGKSSSPQAISAKEAARRSTGTIKPGGDSR